jgi:hypothetical protein
MHGVTADLAACPGLPPTEALHDPDPDPDPGRALARVPSPDRPLCKQVHAQQSVLQSVQKPSLRCEQIHTLFLGLHLEPVVHQQRIQVKAVWENVVADVAAPNAEGV